MTTVFPNQYEPERAGTPLRVVLDGKLKVGIERKQRREDLRNLVRVGAGYDAFRLAFGFDLYFDTLPPPRWRPTKPRLRARVQEPFERGIGPMGREAHRAKSMYGQRVRLDRVRAVQDEAILGALRLACEESGGGGARTGEVYAKYRSVVLPEGVMHVATERSVSDHLYALEARGLVSVSMLLLGRRGNALVWKPTKQAT